MQKCSRKVGDNNGAFCDFVYRKIGKMERSCECTITENCEVLGTLIPANPMIQFKHLSSHVLILGKLQVNALVV